MGAATTGTASEGSTASMLGGGTPTNPHNRAITLRSGLPLWLPW